MKLEEVLPALRAGKKIKRKAWGDIFVDQGADLFHDDWEIVGEEFYQDGPKLPVDEYAKDKQLFLDKIADLSFKIAKVRSNVIDLKIEHVLDLKRRVNMNDEAIIMLNEKTKEIYDAVESLAKQTDGYSMSYDVAYSSVEEDIIDLHSKIELLNAELKKRDKCKNKKCCYCNDSGIDV